MLPTTTSANSLRLSIQTNSSKAARIKALDIPWFRSSRRKSCDDEIKKFESAKSRIIPLENIPILKQESDYQVVDTVGRKINNVLKGSWDSSTKQASGTNNEPWSNSKLRLKAEEFKSNKNVNVNFNDAYDKLNLKAIREQFSSKNVDNLDNSFAHRSNKSGSAINHNLDGSWIPPQEIDNSAIIFSNTKRRETKLKMEQLKNAEDKISKTDDISANNTSKVNYNEESKEDIEQEGESYSSSCSWSSCLREKNADNGLSLNLSKYDYKPTFDDNQALSDEARTPNTQNKRKLQTVIRKESSPKYFYRRDELDVEDDRSEDWSPTIQDRSVEEFPDNLNNGKFKFKIMKTKAK